MSGKLATLEDYLTLRLPTEKRTDGADSYADYLHKNGTVYESNYAASMDKLYSDKLKNSATYGRTARDMTTMGLQNSGYENYIDAMAEATYAKDAERLESERTAAEYKSRTGYLDYLEKYESQRTSLKNSVISHLIKNRIVDINEATSFALESGLTEKEAEAVAAAAYSTNKQRVFNEILKQTATLGLDREGALMIASDMGASDEDAAEFADRIDELLRHYGSISADYIKYLEDKANRTTVTFD